jgi:hypothetical protein
VIAPSFTAPPLWRVFLFALLGALGICVHLQASAITHMPDVEDAEGHADVALYIDGDIRATLLQRLEMELAQLGFFVRAVVLVSRADDADLTAIARHESVNVAVYLDTTEGRVGVRLDDAPQGRVLLRWTHVHAGEESAEALVATTAAELLRASLIEFRYREAAVPPAMTPDVAPSSSEDVPDSAASEAPGMRRREVLFFGAGLGGVWAHFKGPGALAMQTSLDVAPSPHWRVGVVGVLPLLAARQATAQGDVRVSPWQVALRGQWLPTDPLRRVRPVYGLGVGAVFHVVAGQAPASHVTAHTERLLALSAQASIGLQVRLSGIWSLRGTGDVGVALWPNRVVVADAAPTYLSRPWLSLWLSAQAVLW